MRPIDGRGDGRFRAGPWQRLVIASVALAAAVAFEGVSTGQVAPFEAVKDAFQPRTVQREGGLPPWAFPTLDEFRKRYDRHDRDAKPVRVLEASACVITSDGPETRVGLRLVGSIRGAGRKWTIDPVLTLIRRPGATRNPLHRRMRWTITAGSWDSGRVNLRAEYGRTRVELTGARITQAPAVPIGCWVDWIYAETLLAHGLDSAPDPKLPVGQCSRDPAPAQVAMRIADRAEFRGDLGRFLRMRFRIVGDLFDREAWSSTDDVVRSPRLDSITEAPVDVARLLAGIVLRFETEETPCPRPNPWRLGRAIACSEIAGTMTARLRTLVEDPSLDEWNRLRALVTLASVLSYDRSRPPLGEHDARTRTDEDVAGELRKLRLPRIGEYWLEAE